MLESVLRYNVKGLWDDLEGIDSLLEILSPRAVEYSVLVKYKVKIEKVLEEIGYDVSLCRWEGCYEDHQKGGSECDE